MTLEEAQAILKKVKYKRTRIVIERASYHHDHVLRLTMTVADIYGGPPIPLNLSQTIDLDRMTEAILVCYVFDMCVDMERHEASEWFQYDGKRPMDPHKGEQGHDTNRPIADYPKFETEVRHFGNVRARLFEEEAARVPDHD